MKQYKCKRCRAVGGEDLFYFANRDGKKIRNSSLCRKCYAETHSTLPRHKRVQFKMLEAPLPKCRTCGVMVSPYLWIEINGYIHCYDCGNAIREGEKVMVKCSLCERRTGVPMSWNERVYCPDCYPLILEAEAEHDVERITRTRAGCKDLPRPCPHTDCRLNLSGQMNRWKDLPDSGCVADILDREPWGHTLDEVGEVFGITRERARQIESTAIRKIRSWCRVNGVSFEELQGVLGNWDMEEDQCTRKAKLRREKYLRERSVVRSSKSESTCAAQGDGA